MDDIKKFIHHWCGATLFGDTVTWNVHFGHDDAAMIIEMAEASHLSPKELIESIVHHVCNDDRAAHGGTTSVDYPPHTIN